jgi:hypothetical protein
VTIPYPLYLTGLRQPGYQGKIYQVFPSTDLGLGLGEAMGIGFTEPANLLFASLTQAIDFKFKQNCAPHWGRCAHGKDTR